MLHSRDARHAQSGGMISSVVVINGRVVGTWKRTTGQGNVTVAPTFFRRCSAEQKHLVSQAAERYGDF